MADETATTARHKKRPRQRRGTERSGFAASRALAVKSAGNPQLLLICRA